MRRLRETNINTAAFWDETYRREIAEGRSRGEPAIFGQLVRWLSSVQSKLQRDAYWLDAGCGMGEAGAFVADALGWPQKGVGVDASSAAVEHLRRSLPAGTSFGYQTADLHALPFADDGFDLVFCSETVEHLDDPERAVAELARVVRPGLPVVLTVPYRNRNDSDEHVWEFEPADVCRWADRFGELVYLDCAILHGWPSMCAAILKRGPDF